MFLMCRASLSSTCMTYEVCNFPWEVAYGETLMNWLDIGDPKGLRCDSMAFWDEASWSRTPPSTVSSALGEISFIPNLGRPCLKLEHFLPSWSANMSLYISFMSEHNALNLSFKFVTWFSIPFRHFAFGFETLSNGIVQVGELLVYTP